MEWMRELMTGEHELFEGTNLPTEMDLDGIVTKISMLSSPVEKDCMSRFRHVSCYILSLHILSVPPSCTGHSALVLGSLTDTGNA